MSPHLIQVLFSISNESREITQIVFVFSPNLPCINLWLFCDSEQYMHSIFNHLLPKQDVENNFIRLNFWDIKTSHVCYLSMSKFMPMWLCSRRNTVVQDNTELIKNLDFMDMNGSSVTLWLVQLPYCAVNRSLKLLWQFRGRSGILQARFPAASYQKCKNWYQCLLLNFKQIGLASFLIHWYRWILWGMRWKY